MAQDGDRRRGRRRRRVELLIAAEELDSQSDAFVPLPWQDAHVSAVQRRLEDVLLVNIVVAVPQEDLEREEQPIRRQITESFNINIFIL